MRQEENLEYGNNLTYYTFLNEEIILAFLIPKKDQWTKFENAKSEESDKLNELKKIII